MEYALVKTIHILSAFLLFGTGLGSAFYKYMADRNGDLRNIAITSRHVVLADWLFTAPTVIIQPATGLYLAHLAGYPLSQTWLWLSLLLFVIAGLCWLPVVWLQIRMRDMACHALATDTPLPERYHQMARIWFWLGIPAFLAITTVIFLMVFKPYA
ncbi:DUF2269 domain-containing protein [Thermithiobacillus plumbiphilus]|uniref:DUF2269 domain-containing protein n=1 Tax=Thermithiobacillus plumbiphilus TaxID=1729899 RepID=A0ABU9DAZ2_9PROT